MAAMPARRRPHDLARYFHLDDADQALIAPKRGAHNRLRTGPVVASSRSISLALMRLQTVRELGIQLPAATRIPATRVAALASVRWRRKGQRDPAPSGAAPHGHPGCVRALPRSIGTG